MKRQGGCSSDIPSELAACGGEERKKDFLGTPQTPAGWLRPLHPRSSLAVSKVNESFWGHPYYLPPRQGASPAAPRSPLAASKVNESFWGLRAPRLSCPYYLPQAGCPARWLRPLHPPLTQSVAALAPRWQAGWEPGGWGRIDYRYGVPVLRQYGSWHRKLAIAGP